MTPTISCDASTDACHAETVGPPDYTQSHFVAKGAQRTDTGGEKLLLEKLAQINELLNKPEYTDRDKAEIKALLVELGVGKRDDGEWVNLRQISRGRLLRRPKTGGLEVIASGRDDWIGWVERKS